MNIAILIPELGGGGAEKVASNLCDYFYNKGHQVYIFLGEYHVIPKYKVKGKMVKTGIRPIFDGSYRELNHLLHAVSIMKKYKQKYKIDVSISFMEEFNYINILSKTTDKVVIRICTIFSKRNDIYKPSLFLNKHVMKMIYNRADRIIVMTEYAKRELQQYYGIRKKLISKIPNPVCICKENNNNSDDWEFGKNVVISVGRLQDIKQYNVALRAISLVKKHVDDVQYIILGEGKNRGKILQLAKKLGIEDSVHLLGFKNDTTYYLRNSKIFMMTSKVEGFPNSMIEAMEVGIPVISINSYGAPSEILNESSGIISDIVYGKYGIITPLIENDEWNTRINEEEKKLTEAIMAIFSDYSLYSFYRTSAQEKAKQYSYQKVMSLWDTEISK